MKVSQRERSTVSNTTLSLENTVLVTLTAADPSSRGKNKIVEEWESPYS